MVWLLSLAKLGFARLNFWILKFWKQKGEKNLPVQRLQLLKVASRWFMGLKDRIMEKPFGIREFPTFFGITKKSILKYNV